MPNHLERLKLLQEINFKPSETGSIEANSDSLKKTEIILDATQKHVKEVSLKYGKEVFKNLDDLSYTQEGSLIISELGNVVLLGFKLGER